MSRGPDTQHAGLVEGARAFVLLAITASAVWSREVEALSSLFALATIWVTCSWLLRTRTPAMVTSVLEAALVAMVAGLFYDSAPAILACLAVPPFVHGLSRGAKGVAETLVVQVVMLTALVTVRSDTPDAGHVAELFIWLVTGLGLGLIASFFMSGTPTADDSTVAYHEARALLHELNDLSSKLEGGLDPTSMGGALLEEVSSTLPLSHVAVHVQRNQELLPLVTRSPHADDVSGTTSDPTSVQDGWPDDAEVADASVEVLVRTAWATGDTLVEGHAFAFRVESSGTPVAVVSGLLAPGLDAHPDELTQQLDLLATRLAPTALRLDTAQLFASFRDAAMSEERNRLAREMHDGVAQDIASMGYVVDALLSTAEGPQKQALTQLRRMISQVVAEVRRSVMTLRTQAGSSESLGAAIATLARHLSDVSGTPIKVTVDERTSRLRHEVEAELLRIAQEAMNNAVKHSRASLIDVHCRVQAPYAEIVVADDGLGLQAGRRDSHGLSIMRERASLIGGVLEVRSSPDRGTRVTVQVGARPDRAPGSAPAA